VRDYVHVVDLVDAHIAVMAALANPPVLFNVGTGKGVSVREFVDTCIKVTGVEINVKVQKTPRPGDYAEVYADVSRIKEQLNWTARYTDLEESMRHAWSWRSQHKTRY
jgi:UDP-arabinose 4-epimerase